MSLTTQMTPALTFSGRGPSRLPPPGARATTVAYPTPIWLQVLAALMTFVCMSDLIAYTYLPRIDVALATLLVLGTLHHGSRLSLAAAVFLLVSLVAGARVGELEWAAGRAIKLFLIWFAATQWSAYPLLPKTMFRTAIGVLAINAALVVLMVLGFDWAIGEISGNGRKSTLLTMPGGLARIGLVPLFYFLYRVMAPAVPRPWDVAGVGACLLVIWCDGSRTAFLMIAVCWAAVFLCMVWERRATKVTGMLALSIFGGVILPGIMLQFLDSDNPLQRIVKFLDEGVAVGLASVDNERFELNAAAVRMILDDPLFGHGLGTAKHFNPNHAEGFEVVHNAYLQQWAECGVAGFVSLMVIFWGWLPHGGRVAWQLRRQPPKFDRAYYYNAMYCLASFGLMKLTHPLASEWSDWLMFTYCHAAIHAFRPAPVVAVARTQTSSARPVPVIRRAAA